MKGLEKPLHRRGCPRPHSGTKTSRAQVSPVQPMPPQQMTPAGLVGRSGHPDTESTSPAWWSASKTALALVLRWNLTIGQVCSEPTMQLCDQQCGHVY